MKAARRILFLLARTGILFALTGIVLIPALQALTSEPDGGVVEIDVQDLQGARVDTARIYFCGQGPLTAPVKTTVDGHWLSDGCQMQVWVGDTLVDAEQFTPHADYPFKRTVKVDPGHPTPATDHGILPKQRSVESSVPHFSTEDVGVEASNHQASVRAGETGATVMVWGSDGYASDVSTCSSYRYGSKSCFIEFDGIQRDICEVCREGKSCFMALKKGIDQDLCEAYVEDKSCFMAIGNGVDRGWCEHLKEGKSCFMALEGSARQACEEGRIPIRHLIWRQ